MAQVELSFGRPSTPGRRFWSVGQVVRAANRLLEQQFSGLWIEGEVSNLKIAASGHAYFSLIEDGACLQAAMWRSSVQRLRFRLENGQTLRVYGRLGIYDRQGRFQLYAERAEPAGLGALMLELEQRKAKLEAEGLFATDRKRPLPPGPRVVGVVTSARGAAIHDVLEVARRRCRPRILISPAVVQGPEAPTSLRQAVARLQRFENVDVIIIGRGGGSVEDLWAFNDEQLVRILADCSIPVVSAVGHEVDVSLCDLVADVRAATPSQAAELVFPDHRSWQVQLQQLRRRLGRALERRALDERSRLDQITARLTRCGTRLPVTQRARLAGLLERLHQQHPRARIHRNRQRLGELQARLAAAGREMTRARRMRLARASGMLQGLSPLAVLSRGYAVVTTPQGRAVRDADEVAAGDSLAIRLHRGRIRAEVRECIPPGPSSAGDIDPGETSGA